MNALQFLQEHGTARAREVAKGAKTSYAYFNQIAYGHRRPSPGLAKRLEEASEGAMTRQELLYPNEAVQA